MYPHLIVPHSRSRPSHKNNFALIDGFKPWLGYLYLSISYKKKGMRWLCFTSLLRFLLAVSITRKDFYMKKHRRLSRWKCQIKSAKLVTNCLTFSPQKRKSYCLHGMKIFVRKIEATLHRLNKMVASQISFASASSGYCYYNRPLVIHLYFIVIVRQAFPIYHLSALFLHSMQEFFLSSFSLKK